jgi:aspartyl protease family protein
MIFVGVALLIAVGLAMVISTDVGQTVGLEQAQAAQLVGLLLILILIAGGAFGRRYPLSQLLANIVVWVGILGVAVIGYTYRNEVRTIASRVVGELTPGEPVILEDGGSVRVRRGLSGSFSIKVMVNGVQLPMIFDTGASAVVLNFDDARSAGIDTANLRFSVPVQTANGMGAAAQVRIDTIRIGGIVRNNVRGFVAQDGALETSLLGMSFLETLSAYSVTQDALVLTD